MREKHVVLILLLANILAVVTPALVFDMPIVQTDGATQYTYAKVYAETGSMGDNPTYNQIGSAEKSLSEYPPLTIIVFSFLLRFGHDMFFINGGLAAIFFFIASAFFYLFVREMTNIRTALIALILFILNVRAYYTLTTGTYSAFAGFCLTFPALYFAYRFFKKESKTDLIAAIIATLLTATAYPVQGLYVLFMEVFIWLGFFANKITIKFPVISTNIRKLDYRSLKRLLVFLIPCIVLTFFVIKGFVLNGNSYHSTWISTWISEMLRAFNGYPRIWTNFFLTDGPILVTLALFGTIYLIGKNRWKELSILLAGFLIVFTGSMPFENAIVLYVYRFYTTFYALLIIPASALLYALLASKNTKQLGYIILVLCIASQIAIVGAFYSFVAPAITSDEYAAAKYLFNHKDSRILFVNSGNEEATFRAFKWIVVFSEAEKYNVTASLPPDLKGYNFVFLSDYRNTSITGSIAFESGNTRVISVVA